MIVTLGQSESCHILGRSRDRSIPWHLSHNRFRISIPFCWFEHEFSLHPVESSVLPVVGALYESMCQQIKQSNHHDLVGRFSYRLICLFCENWLILGLLESYGNDPKTRKQHSGRRAMCCELIRRSCQWYIFMLAWGSSDTVRFSDRVTHWKQRSVFSSEWSILTSSTESLLCQGLWLWPHPR